MCYTHPATALAIFLSQGFESSTRFPIHVSFLCKRLSLHHRLQHHNILETSVIFRSTVHYLCFNPLFTLPLSIHCSPFLFQSHVYHSFFHPLYTNRLLKTCPATRLSIYCPAIRLEIYRPIHCRTIFDITFLDVTRGEYESRKGRSQTSQFCVVPQACSRAETQKPRVFEH